MLMHSCYSKVIPHAANHLGIANSVLQKLQEWSEFSLIDIFLVLLIKAVIFAPGLAAVGLCILFFFLWFWVCMNLLDEMGLNPWTVRVSECASCARDVKCLPFCWLVGFFHGNWCSVAVFIWECSLNRFSYYNYK